MSNVDSDDDLEGFSMDDLDEFEGMAQAETSEDYDIYVDYIKNKSENPNAIEDVAGNTLLHTCAYYGKSELMSKLLATGILDINKANEDGETPLNFSLASNDGQCAIELIKAGADVNKCDNIGYSPLYSTVGSGYMSRNSIYAKMLLENGATTNVQNCRDKRTPLHEAVRSGNIETSCLLLYYNADTDIVCKDGFSPFMYALSNSNHQLQEILLEYESDFNRQATQGDYLLHIAVINKSRFAMEIIKRGADINTGDILLWCLETNNFDVFKELWHKKIFESNPYIVHILKYITAKIEYIQFLDFIIEDEELQYAIQFLETDGIIKQILTLTEKGYGRDLAQRAVYILLSYGLCLDRLDLEYIYNDYRTKECENDEFFRLILFMDVYGIIEAHNLIPSIIFSTSRDIDDIVDSYIRNLPNESEYCQKQMKQLINFLVHPKLREIEGLSWSFEDSLSKKLANCFPRLTDLSRNKIRNLIHSKYKIRSPKHFYTIVEHLPVPKQIIELIQFRKSIY